MAGLETAVTNFNATALQTQKQNDQTVQSAQAQVETAKATLANDQAAQAAAIKTAENGVKAAESGVNAPRSASSRPRPRRPRARRARRRAPTRPRARSRPPRPAWPRRGADDRQADLDAQMAAIQSALVAVKVAENNLGAATLRAPMDGTVTAITAAVGQQVSGGAVNSTTSTTASTTTASSALITLQTLDDLQVTANVNEADVGKVRVGNPVAFTVSAFPGKTFAGQVTQIQPTGTTTSNVVTFAVTSSIKSVEGAALYPGMTAQVTVTTAEQKDVLLVPSSALTYAPASRPRCAPGRRDRHRRQRAASRRARRRGRRAPRRVER